MFISLELAESAWIYNEADYMMSTTTPNENRRAYQMKFRGLKKKPNSNKEVSAIWTHNH
jgi:hypothetical protein